MRQSSMKSFLLLTCFILAAPALSAETRDLNFSGFTGVSAGWGMELVITQGPDYRVELVGDGRDLDRLKMEKRGDDLVFSHRSSYRWRRNKVRANIVMPTMRRLDLSGGAKGQISMDAASQDFSAELSGGADLNGNLMCGDLRVSLSGGSELHLSGQGRNVSIRASGGSECDLGAFEAADVTSGLSGGSRATVAMNGVLNANQSGGSEFVYYGNARLGRMDLSGGSRIREGD